jgi:hypothetical protein
MRAHKFVPDVPGASLQCQVLIGLSERLRTLVLGNYEQDRSMSPNNYVPTSSSPMATPSFALDSPKNTEPRVWVNSAEDGVCVEEVITFRLAARSREV